MTIFCDRIKVRRLGEDSERTKFVAKQTAKFCLTSVGERVGSRSGLLAFGDSVGDCSNEKRWQARESR